MTIRTPSLEENRREIGGKGSSFLYRLKIYFLTITLLKDPGTEISLQRSSVFLPTSSRGPASFLKFNTTKPK